MRQTVFLKHVLAVTALLVISIHSWGADGDIFTANTVEGVQMTFKVISESEKTCQVGNGSSSISSSYSGAITIPSSANGYAVTSIGVRALSICSGLTSVTIPSSVRVIEERAFSGCSGLTSIAVPSSVTSIRWQAFYGCSGLTSITIPESVTSIGSQAFYGCSGLTSIIIPSSVTSIEGNTLFEGCSGLTSIMVDSSNPVYDSRDNCNAIIETSSNRLLNGCQNTTIPSSVTSIGGSAFSDCSGLTSITIPSSVTRIWDYAFAYCSGLTSITIQNGLTIIGEGVFEYCSGLTSITIPSSVTSIRNYAFAYCSGLTSITIPSSVTSIWDHAFWGCSGLTSIDIPSSVTSIEDYTFYGCSGLTEIAIPESVTKIGERAFDGCSSLTSVVVNNSTPVTIDETTFSNRANATLYVPVGSKSAYENADYWKDFKEILETDGSSEPQTGIEVTDISQLSDAIYITPLSGHIGSQLTLEINLKNAQEATAYVFDLVLPEGITVAKNANDKYIDELSNRHDDHTRTFNYRGNNIYSLSALSGNSELLTGNDGPIRILTLDVSGSMAEGMYAIEIRNASYALSDGSLKTLPNTTSAITVVDYILGDVNGNDGVDIGDAVSIVNYLVGKTSSNFVEKAADTNKNGKVDIGDAVTIVNYLVGKTTSLVRSVKIWDEKEPQ